jgi:hypothetical protein
MNLKINGNLTISLILLLRSCATKANDASAIISLMTAVLLLTFPLLYHIKIVLLSSALYHITYLTYFVDVAKFISDECAPHCLPSAIHSFSKVVGFFVSFTSINDKFERASIFEQARKTLLLTRRHTRS